MTTITQHQLLEALAAEEEAIAALLGRIDEAQWGSVRRADGWSLPEVLGHIGDSAYGMALMAEQGSALTGAPTDANGRLDIDTINEQRRQRHATMSRDKIEQRVKGGLAEARRVIEQTPDADLANPGPFGPNSTKGEWLDIIIRHAASHREEVAKMVVGR